MDTKNSKEFLEALLSRQGDDDLTPEETQTLERLLEDDANRPTAEQYATLNRQLRRLSDRDLPVNWEGFVGQVHARIGEDHSPLRAPRVVRWLSPLAAAACVAFVALVYWNAMEPTRLAKGPSTPTEAVMRIAYYHPNVETVPGSEQVLAVNIARTPPSPDWQPRAASRKPPRVIAVCGPDPLGTVDPSLQNPVF